MQGDGTFQAHYSFVDNGERAKDSTLHLGGYTPHEFLSGRWKIEGPTLVLVGNHVRFEAQLHHSVDGWEITWDNLMYFRQPN